MMTGFVIHSQNIKLLEKICRPLLLSIKQKRWFVIDNFERVNCILSIKKREGWW